jgi:hypothetical protein
MGKKCSKHREMRNMYNFWLKSLKGRDHFEDLDVDEDNIKTDRFGTDLRV